MKTLHKIVTIVVAVVALTIAYKQGLFDQLATLYSSDALVELVASWGTYAYVGYLAVYVIGGLVVFPGSILAVTGGILFGPLEGTVLVVIGAWLGAMVNFLVSRFLLHDFFEKRLQHLYLYQKMHSTSENYSIEFLMVIRTSPGLPFSIKNYLCGLTEMGIVEYAIGSFFMLIPGAIMYAATAGAVAHKELSIEVMVAMAVAYGVIGVVYWGYKRWNVSARQRSLATSSDEIDFS